MNLFELKDELQVRISPYICIQCMSRDNISGANDPRDVFTMIREEIRANLEDFGNSRNEITISLRRKSETVATTQSSQSHARGLVGSSTCKAAENPRLVGRST